MTLIFLNILKNTFLEILFEFQKRTETCILSTGTWVSIMIELITSLTRMHSSRMCSSDRLGEMPEWGCVCQGGGCLPGGVAYLGWVYTIPPRHRGRHPPPWAEFLTHTCENVTFPQQQLRMVIIMKGGMGYN